jgi:TRAP-type C4-dicarboxylate transport system permease small subunit
MMLAVVYEVVMRYFLGRPTIWVVELSEYSLLFITFLGATWVLRREGHVKLDLVLGRLNPRTQVLLNIITSVLSAAICLALLWYSAEVTWDHFQSGWIRPKVLNIPSAYILVIIPVGSLLLFIQFLRRSYEYLRSWRGLRDKEQRNVVEKAAKLG